MPEKKKWRFFKKKVNSEECDPNKLTSIVGTEALRENYQKCCPKGIFGRKNKSPYCKQLDLNYQAAVKAKNDSRAYYGYEPGDQVTTFGEGDDFDDEAFRNSNVTTKPNNTRKWYKPWKKGGTKRHHRRSRRHRQTRRHRRTKHRRG